MKSYNLQRVLALLALTLGGLPASQAATNWSASFSGCTNGSTLASSGAWSTSTNTSCPTESGGVDVQVGALAWTYNSSTGQYNPGGASVVSWGSSGLGVLSGSESYNASGPHAVDNVGAYDSIVLKFSESVSLSGLAIGWNGTDNPVTSNNVAYNDSDVSVYVWTGATPPANTGPTSLSPLSGWKLVKFFENLGAAPGNSGTLSTTDTSSYWMISAFGDKDCYYDAFKLLSVAGTKNNTPPPSNQVPEPASLALLGAVAVGLGWSRRRNQR